MSPIKIYNTLTRRKDIVSPRVGKKLTIYGCGPTVYSYSHIGNFRAFIFYDVLLRSLRAVGLKTVFAMNITDIDDKTIEAANSSGQDLKIITTKFEKEFWQDAKALNLLKPDFIPHATENIKDMEKIIVKLLKKKFAYEKDGSVYFDISKFSNYGRLSRVPLKSLKSTIAATQDEYQKEDIHDFALWKARVDKEPYWSAPFGDGRPGWHIECSAMSEKYLRLPLDIHLGGVDLIFPHHENEIAQTEAAEEKQLARIWAHSEHLLVDGKKMSKSMGNFFTLRDIIKKGIDPLSFRYLILLAHYRKQENFTWDSLVASSNTLESLRRFIKNLLETKKNTASFKQLSIYKKRFWSAVGNDLNTPKALAVVWDVINSYNHNPSSYSAKEVLKMIYSFDQVLGLNLKKVSVDKIPTEIKKLALQRESERRKQNWSKADYLRKKIEESGWRIEDTGTGSKIRHKS